MRSIKNFLFIALALWVLLLTTPSQDFSSNLQLQMLSPISSSGFVDEDPGLGQENLKERERELLLLLKKQKHIAEWSSSRLEVLSSWIVRRGEHYGFSSDMILALIFVESSFRVDAVSHKGALGLMQLMPVTAQETFDLLPYDWSGEEALFNPILNLELALAHLRELRVKMGNQTSHYLSAYNMGYAGMKRRLLVESDYIAPYGLKVIQQTKKMKAQKKRINGGI